MIQRAWRRYKGRPVTKFEAVVDMMLEQQLAQEEHDSKRKQALMEGLSAIFARRAIKTDATPSQLPAVDPVKLEALKRKFRAQAEDRVSVLSYRHLQAAIVGDVLTSCFCACVLLRRTLQCHRAQSTTCSTKLSRRLRRCWASTA